MTDACTCDRIDATSIGDLTRTQLFLEDPLCPEHGKPPAPEVQCVRCTAVTPLRTSTWEEHDPRKVGWWCKPCRIDIGMDVMEKKVTLAPRGHGKSLANLTIRIRATLPPRPSRSRGVVRDPDATHRCGRIRGGCILEK